MIDNIFLALGLCLLGVPTFWSIYIWRRPNMSFQYFVAASSMIIFYGIFGGIVLDYAGVGHY